MGGGGVSQWPSIHGPRADKPKCRGPKEGAGDRAREG
jgi:hypothetical protein